MPPGNQEDPQGLYELQVWEGAGSVETLQKWEAPSVHIRIYLLSLYTLIFSPDVGPPLFLSSILLSQQSLNQIINIRNCRSKCIIF